MHSQNFHKFLYSVIQGDHGGKRLVFVDFNMVIQLTLNLESSKIVELQEVS